LRERMGKAGRQRAVARFDWMGAAERFEELYQQLLAGPRVSS
jgi:glycosyltransferase involved in cell wall biosynthesis